MQREDVELVKQLARQIAKEEIALIMKPSEEVKIKTEPEEEEKINP